MLRLLAKLAAVDGETSTAEHAELEAIAAELGISIADLANVEEEAETEAGRPTEEIRHVPQGRSLAEAPKPPHGSPTPPPISASS